MCVSVVYIRAFQLVSLSLSLSFYLFLYSLSIYIYLRICLVATLTDAGEVFTPLLLLARSIIWIFLYALISG